MKTIFRSMYMNDLINLKNTPDIKIITGVRRCGKSELMNSFKKYLEENETNINIVYIDFNDMMNEPLLEYHKLHDFLISKYGPMKENRDIIVIWV